VTEQSAPAIGTKRRVPIEWSLLEVGLEQKATVEMVEELIARVQPGQPFKIAGPGHHPTGKTGHFTFEGTDVWNIVGARIRIEGVGAVLEWEAPSHLRIDGIQRDLGDRRPQFSHHRERCSTNTTNFCLR
jgi:hypothetical protein